jgi:hypothetical protein
MFPRRGSSSEATARFCPVCGVADDGGEPVTRLCPQCGTTLVTQGYCPVCEHRWLLAVGATCPKHDVVLESEPERASRATGVDDRVSWVTVKIYPNTLAAAVPRSRLEAEGIPTFLEGERSASTGMHGATVVGVKLQVPAPRVADARIILSQNWSLPVDEHADFEELL